MWLTPRALIIDLVLIEHTGALFLQCARCYVDCCSSPKFVPTPLILFGTSQPCSGGLVLCRKKKQNARIQTGLPLPLFIYMGDSILARTTLVNELSTSKSNNWKLRLRFHVHKTKIMLGGEGTTFEMRAWCSTEPVIFKFPKRKFHDWVHAAH
jgi:hypothetical protein